MPSFETKIHIKLLPRHLKYLFLWSVNKKEIFIHFIRWFLPLLFIFFINGKSFFTHTHIVDDIVVIHSHPFKKSEKTTHNHTTKEFVAIEFHTHGHFTDVTIHQVEIKSPLSNIAKAEYIRKENLFSSEENRNVLLRAPPYIS